VFQLLNVDLDTYIENSHHQNPYNILYEVEPQVGGDFYNFVELPEVRLAIHVGDQEFSSGSDVYEYMVDDFMNTVRPWLEEIIENYRVLYYSGQMDVMVAYPLSVGLYNTLEFGAAQEYRNSKRVPWYVDGRLAGYLKSGGNFTEVLVRNAGHMVPTDQPVWALDLITRFTRDNLPPSRK
jgi:vitellogenic carboxypeptidase-like protein